MASFKYFNVSTDSAVEITAKDTVDLSNLTNKITGPPQYVTICNNDASGDECTVDLFLENTALTVSNVSILHDVVIPGGSTLVLEPPELNYDSTVYALKFKLTSVTSSQLVDIKVQY